MIRNFIIFALGLLFSLPVFAIDKLVLNTSYTTPITSPDNAGVLDLFYLELGKRLGITIEIQTLPAERCLVNADKGIDDGDVSRIAGLDQQYTNLRRVPESVMRFQMGVFTSKKIFTVNGAESLKPYDVGIITGWKLLEKNIVGSKSLEMVEDAEQLFSLLAKDRIDIAVVEKMMGAMTIKKMNLKRIKLLQPSFLEGEWYLYLNKKHEALIPKIAAEIKAMKADGTHKRIFDSVMNRYAL